VTACVKGLPVLYQHTRLWGIRPYEPKGCVTNGGSGGINLDWFGYRTRVLVCVCDGLVLGAGLVGGLQFVLSLSCD